MEGGVLAAAMGGFGIAVLIGAFLLLKSLYKKIYSSIFGERDKVIKEGKLAFSNGINEEENPYDSSQPGLYKAWRKGWQYSKKARSKRNV